MNENKYVTPKRCAEAVSRHIKDKQTYILVIGCGTGLSGEAFISEGFYNIDGTDFSDEMLEIARKKNIYNNLFFDDINKSNLNFQEHYLVVAAVGVISPTHAKAETINQILSYIKKSGILVFSLNDHALEDEVYVNKIKDLKNNKSIIFLEENYGEHIKKIHLNSKIFVIKKIN